MRIKIFLVSAAAIIFLSGCICGGNTVEQRVYKYNIENDRMEQVYPIKETTEIYTTYRGDIEYAEECTTYVDLRPSWGKAMCVLADPLGLFRPSLEELSTSKRIIYIPVKRFRYESPKTMIINANNQGVIQNTVNNF